MEKDYNKHVLFMKALADNTIKDIQHVGGRGTMCLRNLGGVYHYSANPFLSYEDFDGKWFG